MNANDPEKFEAEISKVLRKLPDRRAPAGFEARVLAEIARRAALPWWKSSYARWPSSVRITFVAISGLAAALLVAAVYLLGQSRGAHAFSGDISTSFAFLGLARDLAVAARERVATLVSFVPAIWLYGIGAAIAISYAALGALGAATYRALSVGRQNF